MKTCFSIFALALAITGLAAQSTTIIYQGRLNDGAGPATGVYDLRFSVHDSALGGTAVSGIVTNAPTSVSNGLFIVTLDFGPHVFTGSDRWLEIAVRTNGGSPFTTLDPRQQIASTPYAITAGNVSGVVSNSSLAGTYSNAVSLDNPANQFTGTFAGNGGGLSNVNAQTLGGFGSAAFWKLTGNNVAPGQFLGSTNEQALELRVNGQKAMRYEPTTDAPNIVGGWISNYVQPGLAGGTIGGGGSAIPFNGNPQPNVITNNGHYATIAGGYNNTVQGYGGVVGGGSVNSLAGDFGFVGGGQFHTIDSGASYSAIVGGYRNSIQTNSYSSVGGGYGNVIESGSGSSVVAGGFANAIQRDVFSSVIGGGWVNTNAAGFSVIAGGWYNIIETNSAASTIGGGFLNTIRSNSWASSIGGGDGNSIRPSVIWGTIGGGRLNVIEANNYSPTIAGGEKNLIQENASYGMIGGGIVNAIQSGAGLSTIAGGHINIIETNAGFSAIGGGSSNAIAAPYSAIGGGKQNRIDSLADLSVIGGGHGNSIGTNSADSVVIGGAGNVIQPNAQFASVGGGQLNRVGPSASHAVIPGGLSNVVSGTYGFAAGRGAQANHQGTFVWADSFNTNFTSTASNQFLIRASGGVGIGTTNPTAALEVAGSVRAGGFTDNGSGFSGNGGGLTNVNAVTLGGIGSGGFWRATGNAGTTPGANFVGTTDDQPLELRVNGTRALRLEPYGGAASSLLGGYAQNTLNGHHGAVVAGGGTSGSINEAQGNYAFIGAGHGSKVADYSAVVAGAYNVTPGLFSFIGSGEANTNRANYSFIGSGTNNLILAGSHDSFIGGGQHNVIRTNSPFSVIVGGAQNRIGDSAGAAGIVAGTFNIIEGGTGSSSIGGGDHNLIQSNAIYSGIGGGQDNTIRNGAFGSIISGGLGNTIRSNAAASGIGSGYFNRIDNNASASTIGGGSSNVCSGSYAIVPGGYRNAAAGTYSFAAGQRAKANHLGAFVWADAQDADFASTANNQFAVRAAGGCFFDSLIGIGTISPGAHLDVLAAQGTGRFTATNSGNGAVLVLRNTTASPNYLGAINFELGAGTPGQIGYLANNTMIFRVGGVQLVSLDGNGNLNFGNQTRQMLNLWGSEHGIGVQAATTYFRSGSAYSWFRGGAHNDGQHDPGGGTEMMRLDAIGNLSVRGNVTANSLILTSDRNTKENFVSVNVRAVLNKVAALPVSEWNFKGDATRHIGPMAQDFHAFFQVGEDDKHIAVVDEGGVALAAIQGLNQKLEEQLKQKDARLAVLENQIAELKGREAENTDLRKRLTALERVVARFSEVR